MDRLGFSTSGNWCLIKDGEYIRHSDHIATLKKLWESIMSYTDSSDNDHGRFIHFVETDDIKKCFKQHGLQIES